MNNPKNDNLSPVWPSESGSETQRGRNTEDSAGTWSRRDVVRSGVGVVAETFFFGCGSSAGANTVQPRLMARPNTPSTTPVLGLTDLDISSGPTGQLYVPTTYSPDNPAPLFVALHGAGGTAENWASYHARAEARGMIFLAPNSAAATWDILLGGFGPDVERLDQALQYTFERCVIDASRIALSGFSDGASYALSLGVANGDLFTHLIGFSPGFLGKSATAVGSPRVFISHGTGDSILSVSASRDSIVPFLRGAGYDVTYQEFDGGHAVPAEIAEQALDWFLDVPGQ